MAYVLAGGRGSRLMELTDRRAKPAVYFGGKSRIIDFALSNALNSGIRRIAVATQYKAHSLIRHLQRGWNFLQPVRNESFDILPASQRVAEDQWYAGTADAVFQNIDIIDGYAPEYIVILAGDHVYKMDYERMLRAARQRRRRRHRRAASRCRSPRRRGFGVMHVDADDRIVAFVEKPDAPAGDAGPARLGAREHGHLRVPARVPATSSCGATPPTRTRRRDFGKDIIPCLVAERQGGRAPLHALLRALARRGRGLLARRRHDRRLLGGQHRPDRRRARRSTSTTATGRSGPTPRSRRRRSSCTTSTAGAASASRRWSPAAASSPARRCGARCCSPACTCTPTAQVENAVILPYVDVGRARAAHQRRSSIAACRFPPGLVVGEDPELDARALPPHRARRLPHHAADDRPARPT